jgi:putative hydrolase of the HAD superfamily
MRLLKVILTDLDGVIRHWDSDALHIKEVVLGLASGHLYSICFEKELLSQAVTGKIADVEWRRLVQERLAQSVGETSAEELADAWTNSEVIIDRAIIGIYARYFPEAKVVLATNATSRLQMDLKNQGLDDMFDGILNSSELGIAKPSHGYFNKAMSELGVRYEDVIYIDDSRANVQSAQQLGIRSHQYKNHTHLVEFLIDAQSVFL